MFAGNLSDNEYHGLNLMLSAKLRVVTIFVRLVSLSNHKNMRQRYITNTLSYIYVTSPRLFLLNELANVPSAVRSVLQKIATNKKRAEISAL